jgi:hypothetical protein
VTSYRACCLPLSNTPPLEEDFGLENATSLITVDEKVAHRLIFFWLAGWLA